MKPPLARQGSVSQALKPSREQHAQTAHQFYHGRFSTASGNYESRYLVNCAGVHGHEISAMVGESEWMPKHSRGEYYLLDKSSGDLVNHVIFQCPSVLGKGVLVAP